MKIVLLANNWVGLRVTEYLREQGEDIVILGIHEPDKQTYTPAIVSVSGLPSWRIITARQLRDPAVIDWIKKAAPDIVIAAFWAYILKPDVFEIPRLGTINFHPAYLPYNRGVCPNVWSFLDGSPAGVTVHYIDRGIDTGDIIARTRIAIHPLDTAETLYNKTLVRIVELFIREWPRIKTGTAARIPQAGIPEKPTFHTFADVAKLDHIDPNKKYTGEQFINYLRSRSYSDRFYARYTVGTAETSVRLQLGLQTENRRTASRPQGRKSPRKIFGMLKEGAWADVPAAMLTRLPSGRHMEMYCVTKNVARCPETMRLLAGWRKAHSVWFPTQFRVTLAGTRKWFSSHVISHEDRILFFLRIAGARQPFGHIGLNIYDKRTQSIEIDNVLKGKKERLTDGAMTMALLTLEQWVREYLPIRTLTLRVFADNIPALSLYARAGYSVSKEVPLRRIRHGSTISWKEDPRVKHPKRKFIVMTKNII